MTQTSPIAMPLDLDEVQKQHNEYLQKILADRLRGKDRFLVQELCMGRAPSYLGGVSFRWIAQNIKLFTQLPLFKKKYTKDGKFVIDEDAVQDLQQRAPNWSRQAMLTMYLFRQPRRKFPPMLVVVQESWVDDPNAPEWDHEGRAKRTSMPLVPLTPDGKVAILDLGSGVNVYVIDGAHRYIGIKGLEELLNNDHLTEKRPDGKPSTAKGSPGWDKDALMSKYGISDADIANSLDQSLGVEFIPAVLEGETREDARLRVRSVFVHVNKTAQPPTKGEIAILDEDNGFAIVAKRIAFEQNIFKKDKPGDRINWKSNALPTQSAWLTTSVTLIQMITDYLQGISTYENWKPESSKEIPFRPEEHEIEQGVLEADNLFDHIAKLPVFKKIAAGAAIDSLREFPSSAPGKGGVGHLLLRPIGQQILADAVGYLHNNPKGPREDLEKIFARLAEFDNRGGFERVDQPTSLWYGITYNPTRQTMAVDRKEQAVLLLRHLLHEKLTKSDRERLLATLISARLTNVNNVEKVIDWDAKSIEPAKLKLPPQI